MARLEDFHDLTVWQKAQELTRLVYFITRRDEVDEATAREIRNSAITISSKIAASFEIRSEPASREMLNLAKAACGGLRIQLTAVKYSPWMMSSEYDELMNRILEIRQMLFDLENLLELWRKQQGYRNDRE